MTNRQIKANLKLIQEVKRLINTYGWRHWGGDYSTGFSLDNALEAAGRIRNVSIDNLRELLDLEVWNRTHGRVSYTFSYTLNPNRRKNDVLRLLYTVEDNLHKWLH